MVLTRSGLLGGVNPLRAPNRGISVRNMNAHEKDTHDTDEIRRDAAQGKHADTQGRFETANEQDEGLSALARDVAHPFDQTNGLVDGLEGEEDDPEKVNERANDTGADFIAGPSAGQPGVVAAGFASPGQGNDTPTDTEAEAEADTDTDEPQGP
jgi:hypothetical protein